MGRKQDDTRLDSILAAIQENPGTRAGTIGEMLGIKDQTLQRALIQLEDRGDMLDESKEGKLYYFGKRK